MPLLFHSCLLAFGLWLCKWFGTEFKAQARKEMDERTLITHSIVVNCDFAIIQTLFHYTTGKPSAKPNATVSILFYFFASFFVSYTYLLFSSNLLNIERFRRYSIHSFFFFMLFVFLFFPI